MQGGSFNRIIGLSFASPPREYILRIPRFELDERETQGIKDQVAVLIYLSKSLPVAKVIAYDSTAENAIGRQFVIQERIQGTSIEATYKDLSLDEKLQLTEKLGYLIFNIEGIEIQKFGRLAQKLPMPESSHEASQIVSNGIEIKRYRRDLVFEIPTTEARTCREVSDVMLKASAKDDADDEELSPFWARLQLMLKEMDDKGFFKNTGQKPRLGHWDLSPQKILVEKQGKEWKVTGVIDWDDAMSAPAIIGRKPPVWLWDSEVHVADADTLEPGNYNYDQKRIKTELEEVLEGLLPGWAEDAYQRGRWLRRLWAFAFYGFSYSQDWRYKDLVRDWDLCLEERTPKDHTIRFWRKDYRRGCVVA